jgi:hypothetical protein
MAKVEPQSVIGMCFICLNDDGKLDHQGYVCAHVHGSIYMVQYFDALMGEPNTLEPVDFEALAGKPTGCRKTPNAIIFFEDDEHMRFYLEKGFGRQLTRDQKDNG